MKKSHLYDFLYNIAGSILYAAGIDTFAGAAGFAPGGVSGLALILNHLWGAGGDHDPGFKCSVSPDQL